MADAAILLDKKPISPTTSNRRPEEQPTDKQSNSLPPSQSSDDSIKLPSKDSLPDSYPDHLPSDCICIFADLETDSVQANILLQIAAVAQNGEQFNIYINPQQPLSQSCTNFLGFYYFKGDLYRNGLKLNSVSVSRALHLFMSWISKFGHPVALVFHNGFAFDCPVLARFLVRLNVPIPENFITVGDTLPYIRIHFKPPIVEDHKLGTLSKFFETTHEHAHDALSDSLTLKQICSKIADQFDIDYRCIIKDSSRKFSEYINRQKHGTPIQKLKKKKEQK